MKKDNDNITLNYRNLGLDSTVDDMRQLTNPIYFERTGETRYLANSMIPSPYSIVFDSNRDYNRLNDIIHFKNENVFNLSNNNNWYNALNDQYAFSIRASIVDTLLNGCIGRLINYIKSNVSQPVVSQIILNSLKLNVNSLRFVNYYRSYNRCNFDELFKSAITDDSFKTEFYGFVALSIQETLTEINYKCIDLIYKTIYGFLSVEDCRLDNGEIIIQFDFDKFLADVGYDNDPRFNRENGYIPYNFVYCEFINALSFDLAKIAEMIEINSLTLFNSIVAAKENNVLSKDMKISYREKAIGVSAVPKAEDDDLLF